MIDILLDTNILIYLVRGEEKYIRFFEEQWAQKTYATSIVSVMEALVGAREREERSDLQERLQRIIVVPLTEDIGMPAAVTLRARRVKNIRSPRFPDAIIAHTALRLGVPLVTNNRKDFAAFKGLKLIVP
jgi:tRNA(fMet)-specific endonuclease VapC